MECVVICHKKTNKMEDKMSENVDENEQHAYELDGTSNSQKRCVFSDDDWVKLMRNVEYYLKNGYLHETVTSKDDKKTIRRKAKNCLIIDGLLSRKMSHSISNTSTPKIGKAFPGV